MDRVTAIDLTEDENGIERNEKRKLTADPAESTRQTPAKKIFRYTDVSSGGPLVVETRLFNTNTQETTESIDYVKEIEQSEVRFQYASKELKKKAKRQRRKLRHLGISSEAGPAQTSTTTEKKEQEKSGTHDVSKAHKVSPAEVTNIIATKINANPRDLQNLQNAKMAYLGVAIYRSDGKDVSEIFAIKIRNRLVAMIETAIDNRTPANCLCFLRCGVMSDGYFLVTPKQEESQKWLLSSDFGTVDGIDLVVRYPTKIRISIMIPKSKSNLVADPMKFLIGQNSHIEELRIKEWTLLGQLRNKYKSILLVVEVPSIAIKAWDNQDVWRLNFLGAQVTVKYMRRIFECNRMEHTEAQAKHIEEGMFLDLGDEHKFFQNEST